MTYGIVNVLKTVEASRLWTCLYLLSQPCIPKFELCLQYVVSKIVLLESFQEYFLNL